MHAVVGQLPCLHQANEAMFYKKSSYFINEIENERFGFT